MCAAMTLAFSATGFVSGRPWAEDRADDQRQFCERAYVPVYYAGGDGAVGDSESLYIVSQGQVDGVGYEGVEGVDDYFALAGGAVGVEWKQEQLQKQIPHSASLRAGSSGMTTRKTTATAKTKAKTKTNAGVSPLRRAMRLRDSGRDDASYVHILERAD